MTSDTLSSNTDPNGHVGLTGATSSPAGDFYSRPVTTDINQRHVRRHAMPAVGRSWLQGWLDGESSRRYEGHWVIIDEHDGFVRGRRSAPRSDERGRRPAQLALLFVLPARSRYQRLIVLNPPWRALFHHGVQYTDAPMIEVDLTTVDSQGVLIGSTPFVPMLVDSGADRTILNADIAEYLGIDLAGAPTGRSTGWLKRKGL